MRKKRKENITFWLFLAPVLVTFIFTVVIPFFMGLFYTFTDWNGVSNQIRFMGLSNYSKIFTDKEFLSSFNITVIYTVINIISMNIIGFLLALLVTRNRKVSNLLRAGFFLPNVIGGLVLGFIWQFIFNEVVVSIGEKLDFSFLQTSLLGETNTAILSMIIVANWQYAGYVMVIYVAALQNVPEELLEAAKIDGANTLQRLRHIVFPMVAPAFTVSLFLTLSNSFKVYDLNLALTNGGPGNTTELLSMHIYKEAFVLNNLGIGQAKAIVFFAFVALVSVVQVYFTKKREVEL